MATQDNPVIEIFCDLIPRRNNFAVALRGHDQYTCVLDVVTAQNSRCQNESALCFYANMSLQG